MKQVCKHPNFCFLIATVLLLGCGCNGMQSKRIKGPADWPEGKAIITLPEGEWQAEWADGDETNPRHTIFSETNGPGRIVFWRIFTPGKVPGWLSLQNLFLEFRDKQELSRWTWKTPAGNNVDCVAFILSLDNRRVFAAGCAVKRGSTTYAIVAWGFPKGLSASRRVAETAIRSLRLKNQ